MNHLRQSRRAGYLATASLLYILMGYGTAVLPHEGPRWVVLGWMLPPPVWSALWLATGVLALVAAITGEADRWAFTAMSGMAFVWALGLGTAWRIHDIPYGWLTPGIFLVFGGMQLWVAGGRLDSTTRAND